MSLISSPIATALGVALYHHECGSSARVAYSLSYARTGRSGGSFGRYQADCHTNPKAAPVLDAILTQAGLPSEQRARILGILRDAAPNNPLSQSDLAAVDVAINCTSGRTLVDRLDAENLEAVLVQLDRCVAAAAEQGCTILPAALFGMGVWINQDGPPTVLLHWLSGQPTALGGKPLPPLAPGSAVGEGEWLGYYRRIPFIINNPGEEPRMLTAITVGMAIL